MFCVCVFGLVWLCVVLVMRVFALWGGGDGVLGCFSLFLCNFIYAVIFVVLFCAGLSSVSFSCVGVACSPQSVFTSVVS